MVARLSEQRCDSCTPETPPLTAAEVEELRVQLHGDWAVVDGAHLRRRLRFRDFRSAFDMASRIAGIAEEEGHHPDLCVGWGRLEVELTTHAVHGLTRNDFIVAAKVDALQRG